MNYVQFILYDRIYNTLSFQYILATFIISFQAETYYNYYKMSFQRAKLFKKIYGPTTYYKDLSTSIL